MAVVLLSKAAHTFVGLSSDVKPTTSDGIAAGSTFWEEDTDRTFLFDGTEWVAQGGTPIVTAKGEQVATSPYDLNWSLNTLNGIFAELQELRRLYCASHNLLFREIDNRSTA